MVKTTIREAVTAYRILSEAKFSKIKDGDRFSAMKLMKALKGVAVPYDDYLKDVRERLKPEGFDALQGKEKLTPEEIKLITKYERDIDECMKPELDKEVKLDFSLLSEEGMKGLLESNDFTFGQACSLYDLIGQQQ